MFVQDTNNLSIEDRPIALKARKDLASSSTVYQGETCWVVKDPVAMKYFRLQPPEYEIFRCLDSTKNYSQILSLLETKFPEQSFRAETIQMLVASMHKNGLLLSSASGQSQPISHRKWAERKQKLLSTFLSLYAIRFPGVDPEPLLKWIYPATKLFFTKWALATNSLFCLSALILVLANWSQFQQKLPDYDSFFGVNNLFQMGVILMFTKTIHELGHALTCRKLGGECHEIGLMLLVVTPAMYCNTSDSWIMPSKWHRMAIGAGGMYVELCLAALATYIWWFSNPGVVHFVALNIMFLSSVSTVMFNANPLLRYDGYFILSDFLEIPNLSQKANLSLQDRLRVWCLGMKPNRSRLLPQKHRFWFSLFSIASFAYKWFVTFGILWFLTATFRPWGLESIGQILVLISLGGMIGVPSYQLFKFLSFPGRRREMKNHRIGISLVLFCLGLWGFLSIPVPNNVEGNFVIEPSDAERIYVSVDGTLSACFVDAGDKVVPGQLLARLVNPNLTLELEELKGQKAKLLRQLESLELNLSRNPDLSQMIVDTRSELSHVNDQITAKGELLQKLEIRARREGIIIPPANVPSKPNSDFALVGWNGSPLEKRNNGCLLQRETMFCYVGDPDKLELRIFVDQSDVALLESGQAIQVKPHSHRNLRLPAVLETVSRNEIEVVPRELSQTNGGPIPVKLDESGRERPLMKTFEANGSIAQDLSSPMLVGMHGKVKIRVDSATLGWRLWRYFQTAFNFR